MATEVVNESVVYQITVRGPNGEEEKMNVSSEDSGSILKQRIMMSPKFTVYTAFHFEVENPSGKEDLFLDAYTPFSQVPLVGNGATFLLVPDLYDATSIRYHIKHSVALLTNKIPLISQLVKLSNDELPESLKDFNEQMKANAKNLEEKKEVVPLDMKTRLVENGRQGQRVQGPRRHLHGGPEEGRPVVVHAAVHGDQHGEARQHQEPHHFLLQPRGRVPQSHGRPDLPARSGDAAA